MYQKHCTYKQLFTVSYLRFLWIELIHMMQLQNFAPLSNHIYILKYNEKYKLKE